MLISLYELYVYGVDLFNVHLHNVCRLDEQNSRTPNSVFHLDKKWLFNCFFFRVKGDVRVNYLNGSRLWGLMNVLLKLLN